MSGTQIETTSGSTNGNILRKMQLLPFFNALTSDTFKNDSNFKPIIRGILEQFLMDTTTREWKQLSLAIGKSANMV